MTRLRVRRSILTVLVAAALALPATATGAAQPFPDRIELPDGFQPEGIAVGRGPTAFFGSLADGDIYRADLVTGEGQTIVQGPGTPSVGLATDRRGRLFVAGGEAGDARVIDTRTGELLADYQLATGTSFVNDVVVTRELAWFTDSQNPVLYGVPVGPGGRLGDPDEVVRLPLTGEYEQAPGFNANGITQTPDREALLVVQSNTGFLFRVDPSTGRATRVDLGGTLLTNGDGLLLVGTTLYAVQNRDNTVAVVELARDGRSGELVDERTSPDFDVPTTIAKFGNGLYLPNARFGTPPTQETAYWATRIDR